MNCEGISGMVFEEQPTVYFYILDQLQRTMDVRFGFHMSPSGR